MTSPLLVVVLLPAAVLLSSSCAASSRVLLVPYSGAPSHVFQMAHVGVSLLDAGHEVHVVVADSFPKIADLRKSGLTVHAHTTPGPDWFDLAPSERDATFDVLSQLSVIQTTRLPRNAVYDHMCRNLIADGHLVETLRTLQFSLAIVDVFPLNRCALVLPYRLNLPQVALTTAYEPWLMRNPDLPSYTPFNWGAGYSQKMTLRERFHNAWTLFDWAVFPRNSYLDDELFLGYAPEKPFVSLNELAGRSLLWLIDNDIAIDYPRARMPNEVYIGGMLTKPAKNLEPDLEEFVSGADDGVIIVSFGSVMANVAESVTNKMMNVFKRLPQRVIWKFSHAGDHKPPSNIRAQSWIPQNDVLGHPKTRLFVTHCGANSQFEALYHGVPMVGMPVFAEQPYNAKRMVYNGYGLRLNLQTFTEEELFLAITEVVSNSSYTERIRLASNIYRDRPMLPSERIVYWVNHVLKYGGRHLRSHALDIPWYQYFFVDIFLLIFCVIFCGLSVVTCIAYVILKKFTTKRKNKVKEN